MMHRTVTTITLPPKVIVFHLVQTSSNPTQITHFLQRSWNSSLVIGSINVYSISLSSFLVITPLPFLSKERKALDKSWYWRWDLATSMSWTWSAASWAGSIVVLNLYSRKKNQTQSNFEIYILYPFVILFLTSLSVVAHIGWGDHRSSSLFIMWPIRGLMKSEVFRCNIPCELQNLISSN